MIHADVNQNQHFGVVSSVVLEVEAVDITYCNLVVLVEDVEAGLEKPRYFYLVIHL